MSSGMDADMSDRDRLARVVALELVRQAREASDYQNRDCYKVADALIAAGVTMPECGGQCCTHVTGDDDG